MRIKQFIYAEEVNQNNVGDKARSMIVNPLNFILVPFVPATYSFGISCGVVETDDAKGDLLLKFECENQTVENSKDTVVIGPINLSGIAKDESLPEHLRGFMFSINARNVILRKEGIYNCKVFLDEDLIGTYPIEVIAKEE